MKDWQDGDDPDVFRAQLANWQARQAAASKEQTAARAALDAAQATVSTLSGWASRLTAIAAIAAGQANDMATTTAQLTATEAALTDNAGLLQDHRTAREVATARALQGPPVAEPLVLLPLRLQTSWTDNTLSVRIYPGDLHVDRHDPRLTDDELALARAYWATRALPSAGQADQAWQDLARKVGAPRAAWIVTVTDPAGPAPAHRESVWDISVAARLLPDRFAVTAYHAGEPLNVASAGAPAQYVTWSSPVTDPLPLTALQAPDAQTWLTDLPAAVAAGMAVSIAVPAGTPNIDQLVVVGLRTRDGNLADLLESHAFSAGAELLPDGTPTNNSGTIRSAHSWAGDDRAGSSLIAPGRPADCPPGTAGAEFTGLLGLPSSRLAAVAGAQSQRTAGRQAMSLLVGLVVSGSLSDGLGPAAAAWPLLAPSGPAPSLRVGRQPYGILPATAPTRWVAQTGEPGAPLAPLLAQWAAVHAAPVDIDPGAPPPPQPTPRAASRQDESALPTVLLEAASSIRWSSTGADYTGVDGLVGPPDGAQAPATYLAVVADSSAADLPNLPTQLPDALLADVALAARLQAPAAGSADLTQALRALAALAAQDGGREDLADLLGAHLDARSHRLDAWVTAAAATRALAQRATSTRSVPAIGAYGYLTDVEPRTEPRSHGHVHAPSLAHATTAAVLRSGYLGQRRAAWAQQLASATDDLHQAQADLDDWRNNPDGRRVPPPRELIHALADAQARVARAQQGLTQLTPLDPATESGLPLAIDLSSARVRQAQLVLRAVREGKALAAVLGSLLEQDLTDAGLAGYVPALRKLTRVPTGTQLEALEDAQAAAQAALATARAQLASLQAAADDAKKPIDAAAAALATAQAARAVADAADKPYQDLRAELATLTTVIAQDQTALATAERNRPQAVPRQKTINVP